MPFFACIWALIRAAAAADVNSVSHVLLVEELRKTHQLQLQDHFGSSVLLPQGSEAIFDQEDCGFVCFLLSALEETEIVSRIEKCALLLAQSDQISTASCFDLRCQPC